MSNLAFSNLTLSTGPQPLGIFPLPAGYLLLPALPDEPTTLVDSAYNTLLAGNVPSDWPSGWRFYQAALAGESEEALALLGAKQDAITEYNRFVLQADGTIFPPLREQLPQPLRILLDVVAYTVGLLPAPPLSTTALAGSQGDSETLPAEFQAFLLVAQASHALEGDEPRHAADLLRQAHASAAVSPRYAAQILGSLAELEHQHVGASAQVVQQYRRAIDGLVDTELTLPRVEMLLNLGSCFQDMAAGQRGALMEAVHCYQEALQSLRRTEEPALYALAHNNLALAYLSMPMTEASDQLRMGIAVQSLREALQIYTKESNPAMWASVQLNLANALQYLPSSHPQDNLAEAVERYEAIFEANVVDPNSTNYARLLANQGNALAHLGILDHATTKLTHAIRLFATHGERDAVESIRGVLRDIETRPA